MRLNFTSNYSKWLEYCEDFFEYCKIGEKKSLIILDDFEELSGYMLAPVCLENDSIKVSKNYRFNNKEDILKFLKDNPKFLIFRCIMVEYLGDSYYILRGSFR